MPKTFTFGTKGVLFVAKALCMKRKLSQFEEESFAFFGENRHRITLAREMVRKTLLSLKFRKNFIGWFDINSDNVSHVKKRIVISATTQLNQRYASILGAQEMKMVFFVSLENLPAVVERISFDRPSVEMSVNLNFRTFSSVVVSAIEKSIEGHVFGFNAENMFFKKFLLPLKERFPEQIPYVHWAGERKDSTEGVDFIVGYKPEELTQVVEVAFQYKTSFRYVGKHKKKYPDISLFVAHTNLLDNLFALKGNFFVFLKKHLTHKVVIPEKDFSG